MLYEFCFKSLDGPHLFKDIDLSNFKRYSCFFSLFESKILQVISQVCINENAYEIILCFSQTDLAFPVYKTAIYTHTCHIVFHIKFIFSTVILYYTPSSCAISYVIIQNKLQSIMCFTTNDLYPISVKYDFLR